MAGGDPAVMIDRSVAQKFIDRARRDGDCLLFEAELDADGYGVFRQQRDKVKYKFKAHRIAYWMEHGDLPGLVRHTCDRRNCIEPTHLLPGTYVDNIRDKIDRGRARGRLSTDLLPDIPRRPRRSRARV